MPGYLTWLLYKANRAILKTSDFFVGMIFDPERDVVLITGGTSGLGKELVISFQRSGARVVIFDINIPDENEENYITDVYYYRCDVSNSQQVKEMAEKVLHQVGIVTILINNAGITTGETVLDLSFEQIEKTISVNLLSSFYTIKSFLPDMLRIKRGYIITIASTLGYMSPARLSAYGASKSGLIALHESLTYELGMLTFNTTGVKTLLICPGQLKTSLFSGVRTPSTLLAPELDPKDIAKQVLKSVTYGYRGEIKIPFYGNFIPIFRSIPWPIAATLRYISGVDTSMKRIENRVDKTIAKSSTAISCERDSLIRTSFADDTFELENTFD